MVTDWTAHVPLLIYCYLSHRDIPNGLFSIVIRSSFFWLWLSSDMWISYFTYILLFQDSLSLSFLQFMPCWEWTWYWFLSLHDMQLLPGDKLSGSQVPGERSGNKLSHLLWFSVHIKWDCPSSSLWPFYAFSLLPGLHFFVFFALIFVLVPTFHFYIAIFSMLNVIFFFFIYYSGIHLQSLHLPNLLQIFGRYGGKWTIFI